MGLLSSLQQSGKSPSLMISDGVSYDFGVALIGSSIDKSFTVTNLDLTPVISIVGSGLANPFSFKGGSYPGVGGTCGSSLSSGATCTVIVTFSPTVPSTAHSLFSLSYLNATGPESSPRNILGTGFTPAVLSISDGPTFDFGTQINGTITGKTLTVSNSGGTFASALNSILPAGPIGYQGGGYPGTGGTCGTSLALGATCTLVVQFAPIATSSFSTTLNLNYNDGTSAQTAIRAMTGSSVSPALLSISDGATYDFGLNAVGSSIDKTFTVTNSGGSPATTIAAPALNSSFIFKGGAYPGISGTCGATLASGATCTLIVTFAPASTGFLTGTILLNYSDGVSGQAATRAIQGSGASPALLSLSDGPTYDFGGTKAGTSQNKMITLTNSGGVSAIAITAPNLAAPYSFKGGSFPGTGGTCGPTLTTGSSCTMVVSFSPTVGGTSSGTVVINYFNGVSIPSASISVMGTGGPDRIRFTGGPGSSVAGACNLYTLTATDPVLTATNTLSPVTVNLTQGSASGNFYAASDTSCTGATIPSVSIAVASQVTQFRYMDTLAESLVITASDAGVSLASSTQNLNIAAGAAVNLQVNGISPVLTAGNVSNMLVTAKDSFGNTATSYTGTVSFSSTDGSATLPSNYTFVGGDSGAHNFPVTLKTAGSQSVTAFDIGSSPSGTQSGITVNSGPAIQWHMSGSSVIHSEDCVSYIVSTTDAFGNTANVLSSSTATFTGFSNGLFYSDSTCRTQVSNTTLTSGTSNKVIYFMDTYPDASLSLMVSGAGLSSANFNITLNAASPWGNGVDGNINLSSNISDVTTDTTALGRIFSAARKVTAIANGGAPMSVLSVATSITASDFKAGDEVLWMVMAAGSSTSCDSASSGLRAGSYGFARVSATASTSITLDRPVTGTASGTVQNANLASTAYVSGGPFCLMQVLRVPNLNNVTTSSSQALLAHPFSWTTGTGGVVAVRIKGNIATPSNSSYFSLDVSNAGFPGGLSGSVSFFQGDGFLGQGSSSTTNGSSNGSGGARGFFSGTNVGGGGGSNAGTGAQPNGFPSYSPGCNGASCSTLKSMGGGGGGYASTGSPGGAGGGIAFLFAQTVNPFSAVAIYGFGAAGGASVGTFGSGGGAGGTIKAQFGTVPNTATLFLTAKGNNGGSTGSGGKPGAGGGGGLISLDTCSNSAGLSTNVLAGLAGTDSLNASPSSSGDGIFTSNSANCPL
jgi:hypothetical protein